MVEQFLEKTVDTRQLLARIGMDRMDAAPLCRAPKPRECVQRRIQVRMNCVGLDSLQRPVKRNKCFQVKPLFLI